MHSNARKRQRQNDGKEYENSKRPRNLPDKTPLPQHVRFTSPEMNYTLEREEPSPLEYHPALPEILPLALQPLQGQNGWPQQHPQNIPPPSSLLYGFPPPSALLQNLPPPSARLPGFPPPAALLTNIPPPKTLLQNPPPPGVLLPNGPSHAPPSGPKPPLHGMQLRDHQREATPPERGSASNGHPFRNMIHNRCFDAPVPRSLTDLLRPPERGLFRSGEPDYMHHMNRVLSLDDLTSQPSPEYLATTHESPTPHDAQRVFRTAEKSSATSHDLPPRQLVVLDLNGSLLFRSEKKKEVEGLGRIRPMTRRPYVGCLAKYLAHERTTSAVIVEQRNHKKVHHFIPPTFEPESLNELPKGKNKKKKKNKKKQQQQQQQLDADPKLASLLALKKKIDAHPENFTLQCALDAMVWSSVQPHSLPPMIDAAFGAEQAALRACWTRGMLRLDAAGFFNKVQTTKNLETVWWSSEDAYSARSMVLIDDSVKKARLQPWNLLQIPEYARVEERREDKMGGDGEGKVVKEGYSPSGWQPPRGYVPEEPEEEEGGGGEVGEEDDGIELDPDADTTLLAVIGILEELRFQSNIPAWIRIGNLSNRARGGGNAVEVEADANGSGAASTDDMRQLWCADPTVLSYWVKRGKGALAGRGIPIEVGMLDVLQDRSFLELRTSVY